jgi:hypothetical protein
VEGQKALSDNSHGFDRQLSLRVGNRGQPRSAVASALLVSQLIDATGQFVDRALDSAIRRLAGLHWIVWGSQA